MKGSEVSEVKLTTLNVVSPVASISLLIGSDAHHFVFTVQLGETLVLHIVGRDECLEARQIQISTQVIF